MAHWLSIVEAVLHMHVYLQTHLALIAANFIFQEKDAHFVKKCPFDGMGQEKTPIGREKTPIGQEKTPTFF